MKIGIVGGMGPESTVQYYKGIISGFREVKQDGSYPEIVIESIDMTKMLGFQNSGQWEELTQLLGSAIKNLHAAGADFAVIASNTPHKVFDGIRSLSPIPLLSIVEATCTKAQSAGFQRVGLLGTGFTMKAAFFQERFEKAGIAIVVPNIDEQEFIHNKIFAELEFGIVNENTRSQFLHIIERMEREEAIEAVILGCTELPLLLKEGDCAIPLLDTVQIHVESILRKITQVEKH